MPAAFDLSSHPAARVIAVRRVDDLEQVVSIVGPQVSNVGVFPPQRIDGLADPLASHGVSCVLPLGETDTSFAGMPHDGMRALGELVSWAVR